MIRTVFGILIWFAIIAAVAAFLKGSRTPIRKSARDKKIAGVCGGIGESLNIDPTVVRLIWVLFTVYGGSGILAYFIAALIMPEPY